MRKSLPLTAALLLAAGCSGSPHRSGDGGTPRYAVNGTFTMLTSFDPGVFDPYRNQLVLNYYLAYDSLVNLQPNGSFVSGLAEKWTADARSATFTLRPDVTCSDGTPLTAGRVAAAITYVSDPKNKSPRYGFSVPATPLTATGDDPSRTVKVVMKGKPFGFLLNTVGQLPIVCPRGLKDPDVLKNGSDGTGPFVLTGVVPGQSFTFTVRKGYAWGPGGASTGAPGTPAKLVLKVIANQSTAANLLLSGGANFAEINGPDRQRLEGAGLRKLQRLGSGTWLWFNHLNGRPTADKKVRQALVHALDLDQIIKISTGGSGGASTGLVTRQPRPCTGDTVSGQLPGYDVAAAGALLDGAGWSKGPGGVRRKNGRPLTLDVHYVPSELDKPTAELLAEKWKALGVRVKLTGDTATQLSQVMFQTGNYDVYLNGFGYNLPSQAVPYNSGPVPPEGTNLSGIHNKAYDASAAKAATMVAPAACQYWDQAEKALYSDVDLAPISNRYYVNYLKNAQAGLSGYAIPIPTSIRMLQ